MISPWLHQCFLASSEQQLNEYASLSLIGVQIIQVNYPLMQMDQDAESSSSASPCYSCNTLPGMGSLFVPHSTYGKFLLLQSHASYSRCGLGSDGTDRIVDLVRKEMAAAAARGERPALYGAKITGGGSGGTVSALCSSPFLRRCLL